MRRYLERRAVVGPLRADAPAFVDAAGARLKADGFAAYVSRLRRVGVNAEFNGALCRGLLSVRFDLETPFVPKSKASSTIAGVATRALTSEGRTVNDPKTGKIFSKR